MNVGGNAIAYVARRRRWLAAAIIVCHGLKAVVRQCRKRAALFSRKSSAQIYLAEIMRLIREVAPQSRAGV